MTDRKVELLVPAGSLEVLKVAVDYGADAVYIGGQAYGLRAKADNFSIDEMKEAAAYAHAKNAKVYVTANIFAHNYDIDGMKTYFEQLKDTGLTLGQPKVLDYLKDHDGASQKEIAAGCLIEAGSLTSILNRMEEKGLIERKMLNGNRRTFHIFMTESGKKNQKLVEETFEKIEETALNNVSEEEQKVFMEIFLRIYRNLAEIK